MPIQVVESWKRIIARVFICKRVPVLMVSVLSSLLQKQKLKRALKVLPSEFLERIIISKIALRPAFQLEKLAGPRE